MWLIHKRTFLAKKVILRCRYDLLTVYKVYFENKIDLFISNLPTVKIGVVTPSYTLPVRMTCATTTDHVMLRSGYYDITVTRQ